MAEGGSGLRGRVPRDTPVSLWTRETRRARGALFTRRIGVHDRDWFGCLRFGFRSCSAARPDV